MIIDPKSHVPIYQQIVEQLHEAIDAGAYRSGEALPSLRNLAVEIRVNPNTIQRAYEELERQGVIESRRGVGVFVTNRRELQASGAAEKRAASAFKKAAREALRDGLAPSRVRQLFETSLASSLPGARKRRT